MADNIFLQFSELLGIVVLIALIIRLLRQPLIIAYLISGAIIGPFFLPNGEGLYAPLAKFGIILLLFIVGLNINPTFIKKVGKAAFLAAIAQFLFTGVVGFIILQFFDFSISASIFLAIAITFSSTVIITKLLADKSDNETLYGRFLLGFLLIQDIIAVLIMLFLTNVHTADWQSTVPAVLVKACAIVGFVYLLAKYVIPFLLNKIAKSSEMLFIFTIAWCFVIASLVRLAGLSLEIGAIIAGVSLGASPYQMEISSRVKPLRDFFLILFFIVLGSELRVGSIEQILWPAIALILFIIIVQPIILFLILRWLKFTKRDSFLSALAAAQISEFGFIIIFKAFELNYVNNSAVTLLTSIALVTIIISSYLVSYNEQLYQKLRPFLKRFGKDHRVPADVSQQQYDIWIFGYHRIGAKLGNALLEKKMRFAAVDYDPAALNVLAEKNAAAFFGDAADVEFLDELPLKTAKMIVSTIPQIDDTLTLIKTIRRHNKKATVIVCSYNSQDAKLLYKHGADFVVLPSLLGGQYLGELLKKKNWGRKTFEALHKQQLKELTIT
ncbi:MAG: cation:proton antiporter [Candidatus Falkowbacteria bacterium]